MGPTEQGQFAANRVAGGARLLSALATVASVVVALSIARVVAPGWGERLAKPFAPPPSEVMAGWGSGFRLAQFTTYLATLLLVGPCIMAWVLLSRALAKRSRRLGLATNAALVAGAIAASFAVTWSLGVLVVLGLVTSSILIVGSESPRRRPVERPENGRSARVVIACECAASAWALWVASAARGTQLGVAGFVTISVAVGAYLALVRADRGVLERVALAGAPALVLPISGLFRAPGLGWFVAAALAGAALFRLGRERSGLVARAVSFLVPVAGWSLAAACLMPVGMRDFLTINASSHEAQHLGWVNSAFHGKLLGADAGTFYGILREYMIVGFCRVFGATLEHVRMAHVLLNLLGLGVVMAAVRSLVPRRPFLILFAAYLFLFYTSLRCFCDIDNLYIAFGWADLMRSGGPIGVVVVAAHALEQSVNAPGSKRTLGLVGAGALASLAVLYSQEFGLCGVVATLLMATAFHVFRRGELGVAARLRAWAVSEAALVAGMALPIGTVLAIYSQFAKARLLVDTTWTTLRLVGSGSFGSLDFPISAQTFSHPLELFAGFIHGLQSPKHHDSLVEFIVPLAIYILVACHVATRLVARRWDARSTALTGLLGLGLASYRMILARASIDQVMNSCAPSVACLGVLLDDSMDFSVLFGRARLRLGLLNAGLVSLVTIVAAERIGGVAHQLDVIRRDVKVPSGPTPHVYPDIPRAGDVWIDQDSLALTRFVRENTRPDERIFTLLYMMDGGELYFLTDRANPTRYDLLAEIMTGEQQKEVLASLEANPPSLVIGNDADIVGHEVVAYVRKHWTVPHQVGHYTVWARP